MMPGCGHQEEEETPWLLPHPLVLITASASLVPTYINLISKLGDPMDGESPGMGDLRPGSRPEPMQGSPGLVSCTIWALWPHP